MRKLKSVAKAMSALTLSVMVIGSAYIWLGPGMHMTYGEVLAEYWEFFLVCSVVSIGATTLISK